MCLSLTETTTKPVWNNGRRRRRVLLRRQPPQEEYHSRNTTPNSPSLQISYHTQISYHQRKNKPHHISHLLTTTTTTHLHISQQSTYLLHVIYLIHTKQKTRFIYTKHQTDDALSMYIQTDKQTDKQTTLLTLCININISLSPYTGLRSLIKYIYRLD